MKLSHFVRATLWSVCLTLAAADSLDAATQSGGRFEISHATIHAGGGSARSSDGRYELHGSIAESGAGRTTGNRFELEAGQWTSVTVEQTAGAPELRIQLLPGGLVRLSWARAAEGFVLQGCEDLMIDVWQSVLTPVVDVGEEHTVTLPANGIIRCYRLRK